MRQSVRQRWAQGGAGVAMVVVALMMGACSGGASVGDDVEVGEDGGGERLSVDGATTTTGAASSDGSSSSPRDSASSGSASSPTPTAPPTTAAPAEPPPGEATTTTAVISDYEITINPDSGARPQFDPSQARVFTGTVVRWRNADSVPRSVVAADGSFESPEIAPGDVFEFRATTAGSFEYSDGTRPYAVATLEVVSG